MIYACLFIQSFLTYEGQAIVAVVEADKPRTVTYEELRDRLHKRIEMLRAKRHADEAASTVKVAKDRQNQKKNDSLKRNRKSKAADPEAADGELEAPAAKRSKLETKAALVNYRLAIFGLYLRVFGRCVFLLFDT